jgi:KUP system potassium uptake protein
MSPSIAAPAGSEAPVYGHGETRDKASFWFLTLGSIGVVYGDIGTSPLYAFRESIVAAAGSGNAASEAVVLGILSLIIWALIVIVTIKYVFILLRADNNGEGGTLALMALAHRAVNSGRAASVIILLGIVSGALFYGDAIITPALSVLSAIEGLKIITPAFDPYIVPLTVIILVALFAVQSRGTAKVAAFFGPITLVWFAVLAIGGLWHIGQNPTVLWAFNPIHGMGFLAGHGLIGLLTLGAVFLAITGAEALYGSRAFWPRPHPHGLVVRRTPSSHHQLPGPRRTRARRPKDNRESFFPALSAMGAVADGVLGDRSDRNRKSGSHHRRLFH